MAQYIDKDALVAEIEKKIMQYEVAFDNSSFANYEASLIAKGKYRKLKDILSFLNTLEVEEVDLEKEIDLVEDKYRGFESLSRADVIDVAKHFFELGLSVNNPVTAADRGTAEEIIINLKRVEQDYHIDLTKEMEWVKNQVKKGE